MFWKLVIVAFLIVAFYIALKIAYILHNSEEGLAKRFPHIEKSIVVKANRIMVRRAFGRQYTSCDLGYDSVFNRIFLDIVDELKTKE